MKDTGLFAESSIRKNSNFFHSVNRPVYLTDVTMLETVKPAYLVPGV